MSRVRCSYIVDVVERNIFLWPTSWRLIIIKIIVSAQQNEQTQSYKLSPHWTSTHICISNHHKTVSLPPKTCEQRHHLFHSTFLNHRKTLKKRWRQDSFLLACFLPHCWGSKISIVAHRLWTLCHCSSSSVLDVICPPLPRPASSSLSMSIPSSMSIHRFPALITWLKYWSLHRCTVVSRRFCGCTSCSTDALVRCAVQLTLSN